MLAFLLPLKMRHYGKPSIKYVWDGRILARIRAVLHLLMPLVKKYTCGHSDIVEGCSGNLAGIREPSPYDSGGTVSLWLGGSIPLSTTR